MAIRLRCIRNRLVDLSEACKATLNVCDCNERAEGDVRRMKTVDTIHIQAYGLDGYEGRHLQGDKAFP
jgi:hypothetical protein